MATRKRKKNNEFEQETISERYSNIQSFIKLSPAKPTIVYDTYWKFAVARQEIFFKRFHRERPPWTTDVILSKHKFTNAYRASDRVSQYLIRNVIYGVEDQHLEEIFFRIILFKLFNKIESVETTKESENQEITKEEVKPAKEKEESKIVFSDLTWYRNKLNGK